MPRKRNASDRLIPVEKQKRVILVERRKRRGHFDIQNIGVIVEVILFLVIVSIGAAFILLQLHKAKIRDVAAKAIPELMQLQDGTFDLRWPSFANADYYSVEISTYSVWGSRNEGTILFKELVDKNSCRLPNIQSDEGLTLRIEPIRKYKFFGEEKYRRENTPIVRQFYIQSPSVKNLKWKIDSETKEVSVKVDSQGSNCYGLYITEPDGTRNQIKVENEREFVLNFVGEESLPIPEPEKPCIVTCVPGNCVNGMTIYGSETKDIAISWEFYTGNGIQLSMDIIEDCIVYLEWEDVGAAEYSVMMKEDDTYWKTVKTAARGTEYTYSSPRLQPGITYSFRVDAMVDGRPAMSDEQVCRVGVTPMYATIWPVKALKVYSDTDKKEVIGQVETLETQCVVDVKDNMFGISLGGRIGYIDSNYCMINLTEYFGNLCSYDITNSYFSVFMAHGFGIPKMTGTTILGYENVQLEDGSFLVPLLYPTAQKLEEAIENAGQRGYKLKIYEAFRPHIASESMYRLASEAQYKTLPEETFEGEEFSETGYSLYVQEGGGVNEFGEPVGYTTRRKTYWELMSGNSGFTLTYFVSAGTSRHNLGVALDLTLESMESGEEIEMQSPIHDLSHFSALSNNNVYADVLSDIMKSSGFNGLVSEWWHFQDDTSKNTLSLPCVNNGVSGECWMANGFGVRYRMNDGTYAKDCTLIIEGQEYHFDPDGFVGK